MGARSARPACAISVRRSAPIIPPPVNTLLLIGGNKALKPEKARTFSVGADLRPRFLPGFSASVTFYDIVYNDVIGTPYGLGSLIFTDPTFASRVVRNPTAAQVSAALVNTVPFYFTFAAVPTFGNLLDLRQGNFGVRKTNGLDFDVNYHRQVGFGTIFAGVAGNYIFNYKTQFSATSTESNSLQTGDDPERGAQRRARHARGHRRSGHGGQFRQLSQRRHQCLRHADRN
eukprot:gene58981-80774_t